MFSALKDNGAEVLNLDRNCCNLMHFIISFVCGVMFGEGSSTFIRDVQMIDGRENFICKY
jgi:hypothetical protein